MSTTLEEQVLKNIKNGKPFFEKKSTMPEYLKSLNLAGSLLSNAEVDNSWPKVEKWANFICGKIPENLNLTKKKIFECTVYSILVNYLQNVTNQTEVKFTGLSGSGLLMLKGTDNNTNEHDAFFHISNYVCMFLNLSLFAGYNVDQKDLSFKFLDGEKETRLTLDKEKIIEVKGDFFTGVLGVSDSSYEKLEAACVKFVNYLTQHRRKNFSITLGNQKFSAVITNESEDGIEYFASIGTIGEENPVVPNWDNILKYRIEKRARGKSSDGDSDSDSGSDSDSDSDSDNQASQFSEFEWAMPNFPNDDGNQTTTGGRAPKLINKKALHNDVNVNQFIPRLFAYAYSVPSRSLFETMEFYGTKHKPTRRYFQKLFNTDTSDNDFDFSLCCEYLASKIILAECDEFWNAKGFVKNRQMQRWNRMTKENWPPFLFIRFLLYRQSDAFKTESYKLNQKNLLEDDSTRWNQDEYRKFDDELECLRNQKNLKGFLEPLTSELAWVPDAKNVPPNVRTPEQADAQFFVQNIKIFKKFSILASGIQIFKNYMLMIRGARDFELAYLLTTCTEDKNYEEAFEKNLKLEYPEEKMKQQENGTYPLKTLLEGAGGMDTDGDETYEVLWKKYVELSYASTTKVKRQQLTSHDEYEKTDAYKAKVPLFLAELYSTDQRREAQTNLCQKVYSYFNSESPVGKKFKDLLKNFNSDQSLVSPYIEVVPTQMMLPIYHKSDSTEGSDRRYNPRMFYEQQREALGEIDSRFELIKRGLDNDKKGVDAVIAWAKFNSKGSIKKAIQAMIAMDDNRDLWAVPSHDSLVGGSQGQTYDAFMVDKFDKLWPKGTVFNGRDVNHTLKEEGGKKYKLMELIRYGILQSLFYPAFKLVANGSLGLRDATLSTPPSKAHSKTQNRDEMKKNCAALAKSATGYYAGALEEKGEVRLHFKRSKAADEDLHNFFRTSIIQYVLSSGITKNIRAAISGIPS